MLGVVERQVASGSRRRESFVGREGSGRHLVGAVVFLDTRAGPLRQLGEPGQISAQLLDGTFQLIAVLGLDEHTAAGAFQ